LSEKFFFFGETIAYANTNIPYERAKWQERGKRVNTDSDLIRVIRGTLRGNRADANALVSRYYDEIYVFSYRQLGNKDDAMDMTQDIFMSVLETLHGYDRRKSSFRTWLYRVATNKIIDRRRKSRCANIPLDEIELPIDFEKHLEQSVFLSEILDKVAEYDVETQKIFRLHIYAGYGFPEIAAILNKPESSVKSRYYRLIKVLKEEFGNE